MKLNEKIFESSKPVEKPTVIEPISNEDSTQLFDYNSLPWYKKLFTPFRNLAFKIFKKTNNPT